MCTSICVYSTRVCIDVMFMRVSSTFVQLRVRSVIWFTGNTPQAQTHAQFPLAVGSLARGLILSYDSEDGPSSRGTLTAPRTGSVRVKRRLGGRLAGPALSPLQAQRRSVTRKHADHTQKNGHATASTVAHRAPEAAKQGWQR